MFADFEDEVFVNEQLLDESEEWLADVLTEEELSDLEEIDVLVELFGKDKKGNVAYRDVEDEPEQLMYKGGATGKKVRQKVGSAMSRARHSKVGKIAGQYMRGMKGAPGVSAKRKWATRGATAAGAGLAAAGGAALLAKRMKKRKECRAKFPNDPAKYKACVKA
jgi:hypothetical protein